MIRKNSFGNRSDRGADTQAVLMSVYRTLQQRGHAPLKTVVDALTNLPQDREATSTAGQDRCRRLKSYRSFSFVHRPHRLFHLLVTLGMIRGKEG